MKNKYINGIFLGLILLGTFSVHAQTRGKATYSMKSIFSFNKMKDQNLNNTLEKISEESKNTDDLRFCLLFNKSEFLFSFEESLEIDEENKFSIAHIYAKIMGDFYMNTTSNEILHKKELPNGKKVRIKKNLKDLKWKLVNEKREIGKYTCYKAISVRKFKSKNGEDKEHIYEAWYSPDIPINGGPIGVGGLPGLIVELKDGKTFIYYLLDISFETKDRIKIDKPTKGKIVTQEEYKIISRKLRKEKKKRIRN